MSRTERAAQLADASGLGWLLRHRRQAPVVLTYHRIGDAAGSPYDHQAWDATESEFGEQLAFLAANFDVISPQQLHEQGHDRPRVLITFDDGYRDNYDVALPLLQRHGLTATFFITTGFIDEQRLAWWDELAWIVRTARPSTDDQDSRIAELIARYKCLPGEATAEFLEKTAEQALTARHGPADLWMTWDMVRALRQANMTIGGHSATHPILARAGVQRQREEIQSCAERLLAELGEPMRWFSYPVGLRDAFNDDTRAALQEAGVELAFSLYGADGGAWDQYDVRRCSVARAQAARFRMMVTAPRLFARA